ncbi:MAG: DUF5074 domain-containing protein [Paludibacteraceae bacterium]
MGLLFLLLLSCRGPEIILPSEEEQKGDTIHTEVQGFYLLNEGNMGSNKATLDYYDYTTATYTRNIFNEANPDITQGLGDVGNDLRIYGGKLYAVINCSNLIEVMDAPTAKHIAQINIPNCRYLAFADGYGYCTSYAGPVQIGNTQIGYVAKFDTATLRIVDTCHVGFQPDGLEVVGTRLYVANSGGYLSPNYERTLSVIDLATFQVVDTIPVAPNLHRVQADHLGQLWVNSRGDYYDTPSRLYCLTLKEVRSEVSSRFIGSRTKDATGDADVSPVAETFKEVRSPGRTQSAEDDSKGSLNTVENATMAIPLDSIDIPVSNFTILGDSLYFCGTQFSYITYEDEITYGVIDIRTHQLLTTRLITDSITLVKPYGIAVHPTTREIYITDAGNYVTPGMLYCFSPQGTLKWSVRTGDIPSAICFLKGNPTSSKPRRGDID